MSSHRVERGRRSAKKVVAEYGEELIARRNDPDSEKKIAVLEVVCSRMGWMDLFNKLRYRGQRPDGQKFWWQE